MTDKEDTPICALCRKPVSGDFVTRADRERHYHVACYLEVVAEPGSGLYDFLHAMWGEEQ